MSKQHRVDSTRPSILLRLTGKDPLRSPYAQPYTSLEKLKRKLPLHEVASILPSCLPVMVSAQQSDAMPPPELIAAPKGPFMRPKQTWEFLGICRSSLYAGVKQGLYPKPIKLGLSPKTRASAFLTEEILRVAEQIKAQAAQKPSGVK